MKKYIKDFFVRGLMFGGFGPIILAIIYYFISVFNKDVLFVGKEIFLGIVSVYLLAFVHAGASVFNQIEEWGINKSVGVHFAALYVVYSFCYLINSWIPFDLKVFGIFTGIFVAVYVVVWIIVYLIVNKTSKKLNENLKV
jgi:hypothetical protein